MKMSFPDRPSLASTSCTIRNEGSLSLRRIVYFSAIVRSRPNRATSQQKSSHELLQSTYSKLTCPWGLFLRSADQLCLHHTYSNSYSHAVVIKIENRLIDPLIFFRLTLATQYLGIPEESIRATAIASRCWLPGCKSETSTL